MACDLDIENAGRGAFRRNLLDRGRDIEPLRSFALETRGHSRSAICRACSGATAELLRCRPHLIQDLAANVGVDQTAHCQNVQSALIGLTSLYRSLLWGYTGLVTAELQASIFVAVGWMSGWRPLLALTATPETESGRRQAQCRRQIPIELFLPLRSTRKALPGPCRLSHRSGSARPLAELSPGVVRQAVRSLP